VTSLGKLFRTTAFKLSALYLAVFSALVVFLILYISQNTNTILRQQIEGAIDAELNGLSEQYRQGGIRRLVDVIGARSRRPGASLYLVTDFAGNNLAGNVSELSMQVLEAADGQPHPVLYKPLMPVDEAAGAKGEPHQALVRVFVLTGGFRLLVGRDIAESKYFRDLIEESFQLTVVIILILGLGSWVFVSRRVLKRIDSVTETSRQIITGDLSGRLEVTGTGDEFDRLAESLNVMLARIERLMQGMKDVSDNIAHDLKTPLTRLRNRVEAALREPQSIEIYRDALEATIEESDQLIRTFNALLMIARAEAKSTGLPMELVDLADIARGMAELYEPVAEEAGSKINLDGAQSVMVQANRELIGQAIANLIDNGVKYGRSADNDDEQAITVSVAPSPDGGARLVVADHGPGVPESDFENVRQRFVRLDQSRSEPGSGLGLSLVQAVAHLHDGQLILEDNQPGLRVVLDLPGKQTGTTIDDT